jgi:hypothetical protein
VREGREKFVRDESISALACRQAGRGKELTNMKCVVCEREVSDSSNWLKIHLWAGFAVFHWSCFVEFFKHGDEAKIENAVWRAEHNL